MRAYLGVLAFLMAMLVVLFVADTALMFPARSARTNAFAVIWCAVLWLGTLLLIARVTFDE